MILEMLMESLFGVVDMFFVARLGVDSLATVALTESCLVLVFGIAMGLSMATTAFVARRIGEKDPEGAAVAAVQAIAVGLLLSALVAAAGILLCAELLGIMGASPSVIAIGSTYTRILLGGSATIFLLFLINAIFRGAGDRGAGDARAVVREPDQHRARSVPHQRLGAVSAAERDGRFGGDDDRARIWAWLFQLWMLFGGKSRDSRFRASASHQRRSALAAAARVVHGHSAVPDCHGELDRHWCGFVPSFGSVPVAGYTVAIKIFMFVILPSWGLSNSAATLVGQNLGAKKPERAEKAVYQTARYTTYYMGSIAIVFLLFARQLAAFFTSDPAVQSRGGGLSALHQRGQYLLRVGHGAGAGIQRRGRYAHAVDDQFLLLLVLPDSIGVDAGGDAALGTAWSIRGDPLCGNGHDDLLADSFPPRRVEEKNHLKRITD